MPTFRHDATLMRDFPQLRAVALRITLMPGASADEEAISTRIEQASSRLSTSSEGEFPEIQAWRRVFSSMGLKPTQYRSAGEALLRRLRLDGDLPRILPIIDVCNAVSVAHATPLAVFDTTQIDGNLTVCLAEGTEEFETFGGDIENPATGEVIFADDGGHAHARRWAHRQARTSSARPESTELLIVSEAMHADAEASQQELARDLVGLLVPMTTAMGSPIMLGPDGCEF